METDGTQPDNNSFEMFEFFFVEFVVVFGSDDGLDCGLGDAFGVEEFGEDVAHDVMAKVDLRFVMSSPLEVEWRSCLIRPICCGLGKE